MSVIDSFAEERLTKNQVIAYRIYKERLVDAAKTFGQNRAAMLGLGIIGMVVFLAVFAPVIAPYDIH